MPLRQHDYELEDKRKLFESQIRFVEESLSFAVRAPLVFGGVEQSRHMVSLHHRVLPRDSSISSS